jgi:hypothetical protein
MSDRTMNLNARGSAKAPTAVQTNPPSAYDQARAALQQSGRPAPGRMPPFRLDDHMHSAQERWPHAIPAGGGKVEDFIERNIPVRPTNKTNLAARSEAEKNRDLARIWERESDVEKTGQNVMRRAPNNAR